MILIALAFFLISPTISLPFSLYGMIYLKKDSKKFLFLFALAIAMISIHLQPLITDDGTRVLDIITKYSYIDFKQLLLVDKLYREPITHLLFFLVGKTGIPKLIFSISAFFQFYLLLYVVIDYSNSINAKIASRAQAILIVLCYQTFFPCICSFRYYTATAICLFSWYILCMKNKKVTGVILSILACLIHSSYYMQLIVLIVTFIPWIKAKGYRWIRIGLMAWAFMSGFIVKWLNKYSYYLFEVSSEKLTIYSQAGVSRGYVSVIINICGFVMCFLFIYMACRKIRDKQVLLERNKAFRYYDLLCNYMFFCIGSIVYLAIFIRVQQMAVLASVIPILMYSLQKQRNTVPLLIQNSLIFMATMTGFFYSIRIVPPQFDISLGELLVENVVSFILKLLY